MSRHRLPVILAALVLVLCGCTAVPRSSRPEVIATLDLGGGGATETPIKPIPNAVPKDLVSGFLDANSQAANKHASARSFLTGTARSSWVDTRATILDTESVGTYSARHPSITVTGRVLGNLDENGIYTPTLLPAGSGKTPFRYGIARVNGQYRISSLSNNITGLILTEQQFEQAYVQHSIYFYDLAHRYLVPDPRWTSLSDPSELDDWLITELAEGPSDRLQSAVTVDALFTQATTRRVNVTVGTPIKVEIPGSSQLAAGPRNLLAAQVAATLDDFDRELPIEITDGGRPMQISRTASTRFTSSEFTDTKGPAPPDGHVFFLRGGFIFDGADFTKVKGAANGGEFGLLRSFAVSQNAPPGMLSLAAVAKVGAQDRLLVGTMPNRLNNAPTSAKPGGLRKTSLHGDGLTRPAYAPGRDEVWVGVGTHIDAVTMDGARPKVTAVALPSTAAAQGRVIALRLSPEGSRIAVVLRSANRRQALYVGAIVRAAGQIRIDKLNQISPEDSVITDVGWVEPAKLNATGYDTASGDAHVYQTDVDGAAWDARGVYEMPVGPTSFTVAPGQTGWAAAAGALWIQSGVSNWTSAGPTGQTDGYSPVYVE